MALRSLLDVPAPAKLNLFLHVVGRRDDGYHLLQSLFVLIDWSDRLHFERRDDALLRRHDLGPALPADDLTLRAARALQQASGCGLGADISVDKQVPWGAGLGGGSSDAASTLLALNRLWALHWPLERLQALATPLGADLPFFLGGRNAFVEGIGERLTPLPVAPHRYAVVKPPAALATVDVFGHPKLVRDTDAVILSGFLADPAKPTATEVEVLARGFGRNDLEPAARDRCTEVGQVSRWLHERFGNSRMTGSGSAVFARVEDDSGTAGRPLATELPELPEGWVGRMCRGLECHPLVGWAG